MLKLDNLVPPEYYGICKNGIQKLWLLLYGPRFQTGKGCYFGRVFKTQQLTSVKMELYLPQAQNFCGCFISLALWPCIVPFHFFACTHKTYFFLRFQLLNLYRQGWEKYVINTRMDPAVASHWYFLLLHHHGNENFGLAAKLSCGIVAKNGRDAKRHFQWDEPFLTNSGLPELLKEDILVTFSASI